MALNDDGVNLRSGAGTSYSVVTVMGYKTEFTFDDGTLYNGEWYKITLSDGTKGYIYYEYATAKEVTDTLGTGYINASDVNMRSGVGTDYSVITTLDYGTKFTAVSKSGNWYYIELSSGTRGYVYADYVTLNVDEPQKSGLSKTSLSMYKGNYSTLYVNGAKGNVNFASSNSNIVSVT